METFINIVNCTPFIAQSQAFAWLVKTGNHIKNGCFPDAVGPKETGDAAFAARLGSMSVHRTSGSRRAAIPLRLPINKPVSATLFGITYLR